MSKPYFFLIGLLVLVILGIGAFAFTRTVNPPPVVAPTPSNISTPSSLPAPTQAEDEISLTITSPQTGQIVSTSTITISGKTVPDADVAVNDKDIKADVKGNFSTTITLDEGENEIMVFASDDSGNSSEKDITVTYTPLP